MRCEFCAIRELLYRGGMSKKGIPAGAVVRGTDKGYVHGDLKPGNERPVEQIEKTYPYMRPRDAATLILVRMKGKTPGQTPWAMHLRITRFSRTKAGWELQGRLVDSPAAADLLHALHR